MASSSGGRRGPGGRPNSSVCYHFQRHGQCKFGASCRFSHDTAPGGDRPRDGTRQAKRVDETPEQLRVAGLYRDWKRLLRDPAGPLHAPKRQKIWDDALRILNDDNRDWKQQLPKDLENEESFGLLHIRTLMSLPSQSNLEFYRASRSFLLVMTHASLLDSLSLDTYVGTLYNFMSGANGVRAIPFFQHCCEVITTIATDTRGTVSTEDIETTIFTVSKALAELLRRETRARFNEELHTLLDTLDNTAHLSTNGTTSITSQVITTNTRAFRAMIARAQGLLSPVTEPQLDQGPVSAIGSAYPRRIDIPRDRHDNDKAFITDMDIFPTREEISSNAADFLPFTSPDQPHYLTDRAERHIDTHFRLLRFDIFGDLKAALGDLVNTISKDPASLANVRPNFGDIHAYAYLGAFISNIMFDKRGGLQIQISFAQPQSIQSKTSANKRKWWEESKRLEEGVLLSLILVENGTVQHFFLAVSRRSADASKDKGFTHSDDVVTITARLLSKDQSGVSTLVDLSLRPSPGILLEFPRILPATFLPILENLQDMQSLSRLPFRQWIVPDRDGESAGNPTYFRIPPPLYARGAGFSFSLASILKDNSGHVSIRSSSSPDDNSLVDDVEKRTELDRGQCRALIAALTREFAFIQGPPGTGKSYLGVKLMKVLLDAKKKVNLGPIVVVCYTNHALDQFLEHLIDTGIKKIIRIGGRSNSIKLEDHNLRKIAQAEGKTKFERYEASKAYDVLENTQSNVELLMNRISNARQQVDWKHLKFYLQQNHRLIFNQFNQTDAEGFTLAGRHPFDIWRSLNMPSTSDGRFNVTNLKTLLRKAENNVNTLLPSERRTLIHFWVQELQQDLRNRLVEVIDEAKSKQAELKMIHDEVDRRVLEDADVIGITTTGLAKNITTLKRVPSKIIICEEAGEVLEAHMLSALLPSVEHFIQIGDHEQLRPSINNFKDLSLETQKGRLHALDRSQFERLSVGEPGRPLVPVAQLNVQRRMRPTISTLVRETLYDKLIDHPTTAQLPDVVGMRNNVFWLNHDNLEDGNPSDVHHQKSKANSWEVTMVHAFVRHLVRQGVYASSDIAVLTPYTGQLQKLRSAMQNDFEIILSDRDQDALDHDGFTAGEAASVDGENNPHQDNTRRPLMKKKLSDLLRIATVDNFQGEEAKIIIVSLVRSNKTCKVGFLKTTNRINVLLSRAQHGMYLIGNTDTYSHVPMWEKVIGMLRATDAIDTSLDLCCPRHPETMMQIRSPDDFARISPEGGCREACTDRLPDCGHRCQSKCHSAAMHDVWKCDRPCERRHPACGHACQKQTCGEDCGLCTILVESVQLPCGHPKKNVRCHLTQNLSSIRCDALTEKKVPDCNHTVKVKCYQDVTTDWFRCPTPCGVHLTCGHTCPGTCGRCNTTDVSGGIVIQHAKCTKVCGRPFGACNHTCQQSCHSGTDCGLCHNQCEVKCKHSRCRLECHQACAPCSEPCTWSCEHQNDCTMPCAAPCNRLPCDKRCTKLLPCGHQCPGLCGEDCPEQYCQACGFKGDAQVDMLEFKEYHEIDLNETPIVALSCGHFFTMETLDGLAGLSEVYETNAKTGEITGLKKMPQLATKIPACPHCQTPIRQHATQRYNRLINRAVIDQMTQRFITTSQEEFYKLDERLVIIENDFEASSATSIPPPRGQLTTETEATVASKITELLQKRYKDFDHALKQIHDCLKRTNERHQPAYKLHQATLFAIKREKNATLSKALEALSLDETAPNPSGSKITCGSQVLLHKAVCIFLEDKFRLFDTLKSKYSAHPTVVSTVKFRGGPPHTQTQQFLQHCKKSIKECDDKNLPKLAVEATLYYARVVRAYQSSRPSPPDPKHTEKAQSYGDQCKQLLEHAKKLCNHEFQHADQLLLAVNESIKLLRREWYEEVTPDEVAAIKKAMVSGASGIATHSGHWYNCENGHPFAIGECGMPMEQATCPECGARVGGSHHQALQGVTRATQME
ncbi:hypothetical protein CC80DRAFT_563213 [Byssothecium circinans]|uniref:Uncharacterized protein n=1 Tax=Byssothecium circinans TaxID=147558 RepID=A0A6A5TUS1_9PLEO|nr:hypothetical protein CC80DRAFT_563213 [Byssothecium circinans]